MNPGAPQILIVDDKEEAGLSIVKALWDGGLAAHFFSYDPARLVRVKRQKRSMRGIRIVFMDINLIGGAMGSEQQNFTVVQTVLQTLLAADNGPYILITWSSHDDYADRLFQFLLDRLPINLKPALTKRLSKDEFIGAKVNKLPSAVNTLLSNLGFAGCLIGWEGVVKDATVSATFTIAKLADTLADDANHPSRDAKLGAVIRALAKAEAEEHLDNQSAFPALSTVLSQIMFDGVSARAIKASSTFGPHIMMAVDVTHPEDWSFDVHRALHFEHDTPHQMHAPGDVYLFPGPRKQERAGLPVLQAKTFLTSQFFDQNKWKKLSGADQAAAMKDSRLIMTEITPPCDHARPSSKLVWHRYVIGAEFGSIASKYLKGKSDYLMQLPTFKTENGKTKIVVLNSRVTASVTPKDAFVLGKRLYRLRPQLLSDLIRWVSGQHARLGYVELG